MAEYPSPNFGVGGLQGSPTTAASPYTGASSSGGGSSTPWWESLFDVGRSVVDELVYSPQEKARDELAAGTERAAINANASVLAAQAEASAEQQQTMMVAVAAVGVVLAVALVMR